MKLILASASPRRAGLLSEAGYEFDIQPAEIDESAITGASPSEIAQRLAVAKAETVAARFPDDMVLAADTVVCLGERLLGKPVDAADAREMLILLSGTTQVVITGVCIIHKNTNFQQTARAMSAVRMANLTDKQIDDYLASGEWMGKAGGYGIQDNDPLVQRTAGSHTNIVGLPMEITGRLLTQAGFSPKGEPKKDQ